MLIVVTATDRQWEELLTIQAKMEWLRVTDALAFVQNNDADAFINLNEDAYLFDYSTLKKPVIINGVTTTLQQMNAPANVWRINGWPGFLQRPVWEIAGRADERISIIFEALNKKMCMVKDEPGLIAARVLAMIINEAYFALGDNVSTKTEIDTAMKLGTNYPFGPFEWADIIGHANILGLLQQLTATDKRYQPAAMLIAAVNENDQ